MEDSLNEGETVTGDRTHDSGGIIVEQNRGRTRPKDPRLWCAFPLSAHAPRTRALRHFLRATD